MNRKSSSLSDGPAEPESAEHRILRLPQVKTKTGLEKSHLYNLMKQGKFPQRVPIGVRAVGWDSVEDRSVGT